MSLLLEKAKDGMDVRKVSFNSDRDLCQYGFNFVEIYKRSNILLFSGTEKTVKYNSNTLYIFDDSRDIEIAHLVFDSTIVSCQIKENYIMVCLKDTTYIYSLKDLSLYSKFQTYPNTKGICTLEVSNNEPIIITLGKHKGTIRISCGKREEKVIRAHESMIGCICLSRDGSLLATASIRGSIIRVFNTQTAKCVSTIRRGHVYAMIVNMEFDKHCSYLICNSDTTVHIAKKNQSFSIDCSSENQELFPNTFTIRYANPDKSKSMIAVFGSEPESIYLVTSKGLIQKLSISNEYTLVTFHTAKLASVV